MMLSTVLLMVAEKNRFWRFGGDGVDDALHVRPEAHVEHAVGLVEDEGVDLVEQDVALAQHVEQAARGGDQQVDALADALGLRVVGHAAEDGDDAAAAVGGQRLADLLDLAAQLAGRGDDEGGRMRLLAVDDHRRAHVLEDRQHEGGRLAGARLGAAHDVAAGEHARDGVLLDRRRLVVAHGGHAGEQLALEPERGERRDLDLGGRARRAARRACAPCRSRRRPGRRGRGRGRGHARRGPCRRGRRAAGGRPGGRGSRRALAGPLAALGRAGRRLRRVGVAGAGGGRV